MSFFHLVIYASTSKSNVVIEGNHKSQKSDLSVKLLKNNVYFFDNLQTITLSWTDAEAETKNILHRNLTILFLRQNPGVQVQAQVFKVYTLGAAASIEAVESKQSCHSHSRPSSGLSGYQPKFKNKCVLCEYVSPSPSMQNTFILCRKAALIHHPDRHSMAVEKMKTFHEKRFKGRLPYYIIFLLFFFRQNCKHWIFL